MDEGQWRFLPTWDGAPFVPTVAGRMRMLLLSASCWAMNPARPPCEFISLF